MNKLNTYDEQGLVPFPLGKISYFMNTSSQGFLYLCD